MLTAPQRELVIEAIARLPETDREPTLFALWAKLPPRRVDDEQLIIALNAAIAEETTGAFDVEGMIPRIRPSMTPLEAAALYQRTLDAPTTPATKQQQQEIATYTPEQLAELYARSMAETDEEVFRRRS